MDKDKFAPIAYKDKDLEGEAEAEEGEALGKTGVKIPIKKTDDLKEATKMTIPD